MHLIGEADDKRALARGMQGLGVRLARAVNKVMGRRVHLLDRYYAYALRTVRAIRAVMNIVLQNFRWDFTEAESDEPDPLCSADAPLVVPRSPILRTQLL